MTGWIKLHREILTWEWWDDHNTTRLWIYILLKVNHEDAKWHGEVIPAGSFITSYATMKKETGLTLSQLRTSFSKLLVNENIARKIAGSYQLVTVVAWGLWQSGENEIADLIAERSQGRDRVVTGLSQQRKNIRTKELKNDKNNDSIIVQKVTKINNIIPPKLEDVQAYCLERKNGIDAEYFCDSYEAKGWLIKGGKMKDWQASIRTWEKNNYKGGSKNGVDADKPVSKWADLKVTQLG